MRGLGRWGLTALVAALTFACPASAKVYPVPIEAEDEADLRRLVADGVLTEGDFETLQDLLLNPLDVNYANAKQLFDLPGLSLDMCRQLVSEREKNGAYASLDDIERFPGLPPGTLDQIRPFAVAGEVIQLQRARVGAWVKGRIAWETVPTEPLADDHPQRTHNVRQLGYDNLPRGYLATKLDYGRWIEGGFLGLMQEGLYKTAYDAETGGIYGQWGRPALDFGKAYVRVQRGFFEGILGSYTAGFGLGTVIDRTTRDRPDGFYRDLTVQGIEEFRLRRGLFGFAATVRDLTVGTTSISATLFGSMAPQDVYQYDVAFRPFGEGDPYTDGRFSSPDVYAADKDGVFQRIGWETLPNAYREDLFGANVTVGLTGRTEVGVTAYGGRYTMRPLTGPDAADTLALRNGYENTNFGSYGLWVTTGIGPFDATVEYARSLNNGDALQALLVLSQPWGQFEASGRYYGTGFDNPLATGLANPDEFRGQRDRDEAGGRLEASVWPHEVISARAFVDVWNNLSLRRTSIQGFGRVDVTPVEGLRLSAIADTTNRDARVNGRNRIYGGDYETTDFDDRTFSLGELEGEVVDGAGARHAWAGEVRVGAIPNTTIRAFYRRYYEDVGRLYPNSGDPCVYGYMIGHYAWLRADIDPTATTRISLQARYEDDDVFGSRDERFLEGWLQVRQQLPQNITLQLRGTMGSLLPDKAYPYDDVCDPTRTAATAPATLDLTEYLPNGLYGHVWAQVEWRFR